MLHCCNKPGSREWMQEVLCPRMDTREKYTAIREAGSLRKLELHHPFTSSPPSPRPPTHPRIEKPRDCGTWWAAVYEVAQSRTRLKRISSGCSGGTDV